MIRSCGRAGPSYSTVGCTENVSLSAFWTYLCRFDKVTDGTRTRDLRSHNPPRPAPTDATIQSVPLPKLIRESRRADSNR
jgi:hypothetical protein